MGRFSRRRSSSHDSAPEPGHLPDEVVDAAFARIDPEYAARIHALGGELAGRSVATSRAGHSGYVLGFADGTWVAVWLDASQGRMEFAAGSGEPAPDVVALLAQPAVPDASGPLDVDRPHASEPNDIAAEARRTHGKPITGVAIGERAFSLCFPEGLELDGNVFALADGTLALRVFYEQW